jgi:1-acyl-sn-glycerol-3-phosphate acyltransferase
MNPLRTLLFQVCFYVSLIGVMILASPALLMPRRTLMQVVRWWGRYFVGLCRVVGGFGMEVRGREHLQQGPLLVAAKHQSLWETFALIGLFDDPCFILKQELTRIPLFGWYAIKARMLPVDRRGGAAVLKELNQRAHEELRVDEGRQLIFFPEGTRRPPGAPPSYRHGVAHVYQGLGVPCLPVALNSGLYWPRRSLALSQGTILVEILPVIPAGLPREVFSARLQEAVETASERLLREGAAALNIPVPRPAMAEAKSP